MDRVRELSEEQETLSKRLKVVSKELRLAKMIEATKDCKKDNFSIYMFWRVEGRDYGRYTCLYKSELGALKALEDYRKRPGCAYDGAVTKVYYTLEDLEDIGYTVNDIQD